jgi:hypothetical protein
MLWDDIDDWLAVLTVSCGMRCIALITVVPATYRQQSVL